MNRLPPTAQAAVKQPNLTARELECLHWTLLGKTAWETGRILGIGDKVAARHLSRAFHKLGCTNKHRAAVVALQFGFIQLSRECSRGTGENGPDLSHAAQSER